MTEIYQGPDSIVLTRSGAASVGAAQPLPLASLGGNRSITEVNSLGVLVTGSIPGVAVEFVSGQNGPGTASLTASSSDGLRYTSPDGVQGEEVLILDGETKVILDGGADGNYIRASRTGSVAMVGTMTLTITDVYNNLPGGPNVTSSQAAVGENFYLAYFGRNESGNPITLCQHYLDTLADAATTDVGQLSATGSGFIQTSGSFADWPDSGGAQIRESDGSLRETIYYSSRSDAVLSIPATGRGLLDTISAAGAATDTVVPVPLVAIGLETPTAGAIQTVADITTAPAGITWNQAITRAEGLQVGALADGDDYGVWIHFLVPSGAVASPTRLDSLNHYFET